MTRARGVCVAGMAAALLAACGSGGELADDTARRRALEAQEGDADSAALLAQADTGYRIPAFIDVPPPESAAAPDSAPATAPVEDEWTTGTTDVRRGGERVEIVSDVRSGPQTGFDRLVIEFAGGRVPGYRIEPVERPVRRCGSGDAASLAGEAAILVRILSAQAHDGLGEPTVRARERRLSSPMLREYKIVCDFEGQVEVALGTAAPAAYKVSEASNPARLIIDVRQ